MFANRINYSMGPGGIRRGLIWQSGNIEDIEYDPRNIIFCNIDEWTRKPGTVSNVIPNLWIPDVTGGLDGYIFIGSHGGSTDGSVGNKYLNFVPIGSLDTSVSLACPEFPYVHGVDALTDELSYYIDIDIVISPKTCYTGYKNIREFEDPQQYIHYYYNIWQMNQTHTGENKCYYNVYPGENFPVPDSAVNAILERQRLGISPCAYRIKGRYWFSDYPFVMQQAPAAAYRKFPFEEVNDWFLNLMSSYSQPSDNDFIGSAAKRNESTQHYDTFNIPQLTSIGDRSVIPTSYGSTVIRYTMTHGVLYNSFNKAFQMFFSPVSYPMVGSTVRSSQTEGDYWCRLTDNPDYQDVYNTDLFFRHSTPGFISPVIKLPGYTGYTINNGAITPTYIRRTTEYTPAALTSDSVRIPYMTGLEQGSPAYLRYSTLGARANFTYSGSAANYTINFHDSRPDQSGDSCFTGFLQPKVSYHEKYLQSIDSAVSMCTTTLVSTMGTGSPQGFSGRYKFAGFKGKISLFETGN